GDILRLDLSMPTGVSTGKTGSPAIIAGTRAKAGERDFYTEKELKLQQRDNLLRALDYTNWRISGKDGAAELLGLKPSTLADRIRSYGLEKPASASRRGFAS
ncbi:MAG: hypothetical protein QGG65_00435, partial [Gammaproteobacteria bacterium]|nr:hypothetical protein [Gammaproteobacteria bacterium]